MFSPALHSLLVQARVEALHRTPRTPNRGRDVNRSPAAPALVQRVMTRVITGTSSRNAESAPVHGFERASRSAATLVSGHHPTTHARFCQSP